MKESGPRPRGPRDPRDSEADADAGSEGGAGSPATRGRSARPPQHRAAGVNRERGLTAGPAHPGPGNTAREEPDEPPVPHPRVERQPRGDGALHEERPPLAQRRPVVQRAFVRGQILEALRAALVAGDLAPGEVYSAPALGERFGVSATPVREAMQQLALEGAVEVVPNRGFRVVERGARDLAELAEIRSLIEIPVVLRLARTLPAANWSELRPLAEETARAAASGCRATYAEADRAFHRAVLALAGNEQLVRVADDLHRRAQWALGSSEPARCRTVLMADAAVHLALLDALAAEDLSAVRALLQEHLFGGV